MKAALGLDIGTTSVKAVVVSAGGETVATASSEPLSLSAPEAGWAVQSTAELERAVTECLARVVATTPDGVDIVALAAAAQSGSLVVAGPDGAVAPQLITWMDTRAAPIVDRWHADGTDVKIRRCTGWSVSPGLGLPLLAWSRANDPEAHRLLSRVGSVDDFVMSRLTAAWVTNRSNAAGMQLLDVRTGEWSPEMCELAGVAASQLSTVAGSGEVIDAVTPAMAERTGLSPKVPVVAGGHDQSCTALAIGVTEPGQALLACGTAWVLTTVLGPEELDLVPPEMNVSFHPVDHLRTASQYLGGLGASMEWWLDEAGFNSTGGNGDRYDVLDRELADVDSKLSSPFFVRTSDTTDEARRPGAGAFWGATADTTRAAKARAIMEFAAFETRTALKALPNSRRPHEITLVGGATQAPGWSRLITDACGVPVHIRSEAAWPAIGAAILAGSASGVFAGVDAAVRLVDSGGNPLEPDPRVADLYEHRYHTHLDLKQEHLR